MDHPDTRVLARYALGEITDDAELAAFEDHLLECPACRRRALAIDLVGTVPDEDKDKLTLHISTGSGETPAAICGDDASRNIISRALLGGLDAAVLCPRCVALMQSGKDAATQRVN